jgi:ABC-type uncharacterized transport system permease subunit
MKYLGYRYRYYHNFSPGYGFGGIAVALLAGIILLGFSLRHCSSAHSAEVGFSLTSLLIASERPGAGPSGHYHNFCSGSATIPS